MKIKKIISLLPVLFLCSACSIEKRYQVEDYALKLSWNYNQEDFNILHLSDIHVSNMENLDLHYNFMRKTFELATAKAKKIDLIVITGDLFTFATKNNADSFFNFLDSLKTPWTCTFGNHDEQVYFSVDWLTSRLNALNDNANSYCIFKDLQDDDITGNSNFYINLYDSTNPTILREQLIMIDSNRYNYGEYYGYDYIHNDQIDWYERVINKARNFDVSKTIPSLAFFHIPLIEFGEAYQKAVDNPDKNAHFMETRNNPRYGDNDYVDIVRNSKKGKDTASEKNTGFFNKVTELKSTNGIFVGHNHVNNYCVHYKGVNLCYGIKSTNLIDDPEQLGGQVITLRKGGSGHFDITTIAHKYENMEGR